MPQYVFEFIQHIYSENPAGATGLTVYFVVILLRQLARITPTDLDNEILNAFYKAFKKTCEFAAGEWQELWKVGEENSEK